MQILETLPYHGRGIIVGKTDDGKAAVGYFISGRSANSQNRIFETNREYGASEIIRTAPFDSSKVTDPSLIIYNAVRNLGNKTIVTNGDQTDTIYELMDKQYSFEQSLRGREYEPDSPNYTPRISTVIHIDRKGDFNYAISILKKSGGNETNRHTFSYSNPARGKARFIRTYRGEQDGVLLPFDGEPIETPIKNTIDEFSADIWNSLSPDYKISLVTRFIDPTTGEYEQNIINKHG
ncbi:MAG: IMP cyclohydrolase [Oscillospiraceae bacterium]|jgi:hypothetical protein|nr:IMP cyclohydrolase [Oscillospiraceae bacterium]